jgi:hypothetical protein
VIYTCYHICTVSPLQVIREAASYVTSKIKKIVESTVELYESESIRWREGRLMVAFKINVQSLLCRLSVELSEGTGHETIRTGERYPAHKSL